MKYFLLLLPFGLLLLYFWLNRANAPQTTTSIIEKLTIGKPDTLSRLEPRRKKQRITPIKITDSVSTYIAPVDSIGEIIIHSSASDTLEVEYFLNIEHLAISRVDTLHITRRDSVVYPISSPQLIPYIYGAIIGALAMGVLFIFCF